MNDQMRELLVGFLDVLEAIAIDHEELYDTDVRERLAEVIERALVMNSDPAEVPEELGMFTDDGNRRVSAALAMYLASARGQANALGLDAPARRAAVWDAHAASSNGTPVDEFLGWPE